jgi:hypothetical protein
MIAPEELPESGHNPIEIIGSSSGTKAKFKLFLKTGCS